MAARLGGKVSGTIVRPAMMSGLEAVTLKKRQQAELEVTELKDVKTFKVREARLGWFGMCRGGIVEKIHGCSEGKHGELV